MGSIVYTGGPRLFFAPESTAGYELVRESERHLPWLPLGALQKAKHLSLVDQSFAVIENE